MITLVSRDDILAQWERDLDLVTFNWPKIEDVALDAEAPLQGFAKILIAARDNTGLNDPPAGFVE